MGGSDDKGPRKLDSNDINEYKNMGQNQQSTMKEKV